MSEAWSTAEPLHERADMYQIKLDHWARWMAARFNAPVYLVGSCITGDTPRDVDVRIVLPDEDFAARYKQTPEEWHTGQPSQRWVDDVGKLGAEAARRQKLNIDFQVWPESRTEGRWPERLLLAAPSAYLPSPSGGAA